jgi:class 3 adenylate cyclase
MKHTGDGWLSLFDGPAKAAKCWISMSKRLSEIDPETSGGLPMSEEEMTPDDVRGVGVHIAARLLTLANPGELVASSVAHDLSLGSGLEFTDRGVHELKGVPGSWQAYGLDAT